MADNLGEIRHLWLHDEDDNYTVLPYTSLNSIKMSENSDNDFIDDYESLKDDINDFQEYVINGQGFGINYIWAALNGLQNNSATPSSNGLMSKEDKAKLDSINANANNYQLPMASNLILGGIRIDDSNFNINENGVLSIKGGINSLAGLSDVYIEENSEIDGQALVYDNAMKKWTNGAGGGGSGNPITVEQIVSLFPEYEFVIDLEGTVFY